VALAHQVKVTTVDRVSGAMLTLAAAVVVLAQSVETLEHLERQMRMVALADQDPILFHLGLLQLQQVLVVITLAAAVVRLILQVFLAGMVAQVAQVVVGVELLLQRERLQQLTQAAVVGVDKAQAAQAVLELLLFDTQRCRWTSVSLGRNRCRL
jgi:hypothetical protein